MINIEHQELFNMLMDVYINSHKFINPHTAEEYIEKQIHLFINKPACDHEYRNSVSRKNQLYCKKCNSYKDE